VERNQALGVLDRIHKVRDDLEKRALKLEKAVKPLERGGMFHSMGITVGILGGIRRYLIKNEEDIIIDLMESEIQNGKENRSTKGKGPQKGS